MKQMQRLVPQSRNPKLLILAAQGGKKGGLNILTYTATQSFLVHADHDKL